MPHADEIRQFVIDNFLFGDGSALTDDGSFLQNGIIDSTGVLELISFVESQYAIKVLDAELLPENFDSVRNIVRFVQQKLVAV